MFEPQNYGNSFIQGMQGMASVINDTRRLDLEEQKLTDERKGRELQQRGLELENQSKEQAIKRDQNLNDWLERGARFDSGTLTQDDYAKFTGQTAELLRDVPYLPSDPREIPAYKSAWHQVVSGMDALRTLPAGNYIYTRADKIPEIDAGLDAFSTLLSKDRVGKEFTDADGSITGIPGGKYRTADVGGFNVVSGEGSKAAFTPMFSVTDTNGQPILDVQGRQMMVPSTVGQTNGPADQLRRVTPEEVLTKYGFANKVLERAEQLGLADPEKGSRLIAGNVRAYMGTEGAKEYLNRVDGRNKVTSVDPTHDVYLDGKLVRKGEPKERFTQVDPTKDLLDAQGNVVRRGVPKVEPPEIKHSRVTEGGRTFDLYEIYDKGTGKLIQTRKAEFKDPLEGVGKLILSQQVSVLKDRRNQFEQQMRNSQANLNKATDERADLTAGMTEAEMAGQDVQNALSRENRHWVEMKQAGDAISAIDQQLNVLTNMNGGQGSGAVTPAAGGMNRVEPAAAQTPRGAVTISRAGLAKLPRNADGTVTYGGKKYRVEGSSTNKPAATTRVENGRIVVSFNGPPAKSTPVAKSQPGNRAPFNPADISFRSPAETRRVSPGGGGGTVAGGEVLKSHGSAANGQALPAKQVKKMNFFDEVNAKEGARRAKDAVLQEAINLRDKRAAAANTLPDEYVTAYDAKGNTVRTMAKNARWDSNAVVWRYPR